MRRSWVFVAVAVVAIAFALLLNGLGDPTPASAASGTTAQHGDDTGAERADRPDADERDGHGPPSWAHGNKNSDAAWKKAWSALTPSQREDRMRTLARKHARGMAQGHRCVAAGNRACEKPMPPGLARKQ